MMFLLIVVVVVVGLALLFLKGAKDKDSLGEDVAKPASYYLRKSVFTPAERSFFGVLESLNYEGVIVTIKVRLADIFEVKKGSKPGSQRGALNRISSKHVDFLLIQQSDGRPILGIELDDSSHNEAARVARDIFVDEVFASAGLPLLHVVVKSAYDPKEIHRLIDEALVKKAS